jgi:hypothetical protein
MTATHVRRLRDSASLTGTLWPGGTAVTLPRRGRAWDEDSIRDALGEFLEGWKVWPTCSQFAAGGAKGLREAITRIKGPQWWAMEMNLPGGERERGGVRRWTDDAIRAMLAEFLGGRSGWPTTREFKDAGLGGLHEALRHRGRPRRWSAEMKVSWVPPRALPRSDRSKPRSVPPSKREWPRWNEHTIASQLADFLSGRGEWPRYAEFVEAGRQGLYHAVRTHGGARTWAQRMGAKWVERPGGRPPWSERRIREELTAFLAGRAAWPRPVDFVAAGQSGLSVRFDAPAALHSGPARWASNSRPQLRPPRLGGRRGTTPGLPRRSGR